jgi:acetyl-CoA carboxylase carboxyl transferase subunit alpha
MNPNFLDFEQPIADLEAKIQELRHASNGPAVNVDAEDRHTLKREAAQLRTATIFKRHSPRGRSRSSRATPQRPYTLDYLKVICDEFEELAGDRAYRRRQRDRWWPRAASTASPVMVIGHEKGRDTKSQGQAATSACPSPRVTARRCG